MMPLRTATSGTIAINPFCSSRRNSVASLISLKRGKKYIENNPAARLTALVVAPGRSAEDILGALRARLDPVFLPRPVVLVPALPRNRLGKLPHGALSALRPEAAAAGGGA
jgi:acyl-coenzyme A synthetase/AMP-(fatty) acid ligase